MVKLGFALGAEASALSAASIGELETLGADSLWGTGRTVSALASPEAVTTTARLAALTKTATVGAAVLVLPLHAPVVVAKQFAELDQASGGRIALGIGVGSDPAELAACGVEPSTRGARTDASIEIIKALWHGDAVTRQLPWWTLDDVRITPGPVQRGGPPIYVAGRKAPAMRRAAQLGDGWLPTMFTPAAYERSVLAIRAHAESAGRDLVGFEWLCLVYFRIDDDGDTARTDGAAGMAAEMGGPASAYSAIASRSAAMGTVTEVAKALRGYLDAGVTHLILKACGPGDPMTQFTRASTEVRPQLETLG